MSTQHRILRAAEALFARQGYDSTTIDQIAKKAGLTKGAVYYFFKNKAELFCMIVDAGVEYIEGKCRQILEVHRSTQEIAQDVISFFTNFAYDNANLFIILFGNRSADPQIRAMFDERIRRLLSCIRRMVEMGLEYRLLQPLDPDILTRMFVGVIYGALVLPDPPNRNEAIRTIRKLLFDGIFAE